MQNSSFAVQILLCMTLLAPTVQAQELAPPDMARRRSMSYEEYAKYRENMRQQMGKANMDKTGPAQSRGTSAQDRVEMRRHNSAYGQGYRSREPSDRPNSAREDKLTRENRPERPQIERFSREDRGNRK